MFDQMLLNGIAALIIVVGIYLWLRQGRVSALLQRSVPRDSDRRVLLASTAFALTFAVARSLAYAHHHQMGPFHDIYIRGKHIHHLVWGILMLLTVGYCWLLGLDAGPERSPTATRLMALAYGAGAALTLDEFALWLNLEDVYWAQEGRESIDALVVFALLLFATLWGRRFFSALARSLVYWRRSSSK